MDDDIISRFYKRKPINEEVGLRGPNVPMEPLRQILGTTGDMGSYSTMRRPGIPVDPISSGGSGGGNIANIIIVFNGTAYYTNLNGVIVGTV